MHIQYAKLHSRDLLPYQKYDYILFSTLCHNKISIPQHNVASFPFKGKSKVHNRVFYACRSKRVHKCTITLQADVISAPELNSNKTNSPVAGSSLFVSLSKWKLFPMWRCAQLNKFCVRRERFLLGNAREMNCNTQ